MKKRLKWTEDQDITEEFIKSKTETEITEDDDEDDDMFGTDNMSSKLLNTPLGVTTVGGPYFISRYFSVWMLDTNFDITPSIAEAVEKIPGIEGLYVMSRYKMKIGIPKSGFFNVDQVKKEIEILLLGEEQQSGEQLDKFVSQLFENRINLAEIRKPVSEKYAKWGIYILPNGKYEIIGSSTETADYISIIQLYQTMEKMIGGKVITNIEYE